MGDLLSWRFDYDASVKRCTKGMNDQAYQCMLERVCPSEVGEVSKECLSLQSAVRARIDMRDLVEHLKAQRSVVSSKGDDEKKLWSEIATMTKKIQLAGYSWTKEKKACRRLLTEETENVHDRIDTELSAGKEIDKICVEDPEKMCPEGNYATTSRRWYPVRGAAAWGTFA